MKSFVDSGILALVKQEQSAYAGLGEWLATYRHQCYIVLTFGKWPSSDRAQWYVKEWFTELTKHYPRLNAYVSYDRGHATNKLNVHLLVGGLYQGKPPRSARLRALHTTRFLAMARRLWQRKRGKVQTAEPYDARRGAVHYLAQYHADPDPNLPPAQFFGRMIKKRKRRHHKTGSNVG